MRRRPRQNSLGKSRRSKRTWYHREWDEYGDKTPLSQIWTPLCRIDSQQLEGARLVGRPIPRTSFEDRLTPFRQLMTAERFEQLVDDVAEIEARCEGLAMDDPIRNERIRIDITRRLRSVCSHCSEREFLEMVDRMVRIQVRGESRQSLLIASLHPWAASTRFAS